MRQLTLIALAFIVLLPATASSQVQQSIQTWEFTIPDEVGTQEDNSTDAVVGRWVFDPESIESQLRAGAALQRDWCGYGWPEQEIQRRLKNIRSMQPKILMTISKVADAAYQWVNEKDDGTREQKSLKNCRRLENKMITCDVGPNWKGEAPFVVDASAEHLNLMIELTPSHMKCEPIVDGSERRWQLGLSMKRSSASEVR